MVNTREKQNEAQNTNIHQNLSPDSKKLKMTPVLDEVKVEQQQPNIYDGVINDLIHELKDNIEFKRLLESQKTNDKPNILFSDANLARVIKHIVFEAIDVFDWLPKITKWKEKNPTIKKEAYLAHALKIHYKHSITFLEPFKQAKHMRNMAKNNGGYDFNNLGQTRSVEAIIKQGPKLSQTMGVIGLCVGYESVLQGKEFEDVFSTYIKNNAKKVRIYVGHPSQLGLPDDEKTQIAWQDEELAKWKSKHAAFLSQEKFKGRFEFSRHIDLKQEPDYADRLNHFFTFWLKQKEIKVSITKGAFDYLDKLFKPAPSNGVLITGREKTTAPVEEKIKVGSPEHKEFTSQLFDLTVRTVRHLSEDPVITDAFSSEDEEKANNAAKKVAQVCSMLPAALRGLQQGALLYSNNGLVSKKGLFSRSNSPNKTPPNSPDDAPTPTPQKPFSPPTMSLSPGK